MYDLEKNFNQSVSSSWGTSSVILRKPKSVAVINGDIRIMSYNDRPNRLVRFWQKLVLGIEWKELQ